MAKLYSPVNFGAFAIDHRVVQPGLIDYRLDGARTGVGYPIEPGGLLVMPPVGVSIPGARDMWQRLAAAAHAKGVTAVARLRHAAAAPAEIAVLDPDHIDRLVGDTQVAAREARRAGCDGAELDAADGALIDQFLHDGSNRRRDLYGGSIQKRLTLLTDMTDGLIHVMGAGRVGVRLSPLGHFGGMTDRAPFDLFCAALRALAEREVAFVHLVRTGLDGRPLGHLRYPPRAAAGFRAAFPGMLIASGAFTRRRAIDLVQSRWADAIGVPSGSLAGDYR